jgi:hypothetical protein
MTRRPPLNLRDVSCLERTAAWLDELIHACGKSGALSTRSPRQAAEVVRKAKALRTSLTALRLSLDQPPEPKA